MMHQHHGHHRIGDETLVDPVCGMKVTADPAKSVSHEGTTYYFCSTRCMEKFSADPLRYAEKKKRPGAEAAPGTIYTCPMHPEIRQGGPGNCPKCGMALEPVLASADERPSPELLDMTRRFWIGLVLTVPVFALEMSGHVESEDRHRQYKADPEPPRHVEELRTGPLVRARQHGLERHAAFGAVAGTDLPDFGVHRAGVDRAGRSLRPQRLLLLGVAPRVSRKLLHAARAAEVIGDAL